MPDRRSERNSELRSNWDRMFVILRKNRSATLAEISALSDVSQENMEKIISASERRNLVTVTRKGSPFTDLVTIKERAAAASAY